MMFIINAYRYLVNLIHTTFDGTNEYISVSHDASIDFERTDAFSISIWTYIDTSKNHFQFVKRDLTSNERGYQFIVALDNKIYFQLRSTSSNRFQINTNNTINNNQWYNIVVTYDGSSSATGATIYIDGVSQATTTSINALTTTIQNSVSLNLGTWNSNYIDGKLDKVIIYDKELTSGEVTTIYNYGRKAGLIGIGNEVSQWELDALNPSDVIGSNDGTSTNMDSSNIVIG